LFLKIVVYIYMLSLIFLLPYCYICYFFVYGATKYNARKVNKIKRYPVVTIQLPIYNEKLVFTRLLKSTTDINWPKSKLEILVLDDSSDDTNDLIDSEVYFYRSKGYEIRVIRKRIRKGFKAGALQNALTYSQGEYLVVFDADSIPSSNFLLNTIPFLEESPKLGYIQTRLGHINRNFNKITEMISIALDCHFMIEQPARDSLSLVTTFNGSAGVLRKQAILDIGGWSSETLTEDMELSYRMRINGWGSMYLRDVVVQSEVPLTLSDFKKQQARWSCGCAQTAKKLLKIILVSKNFSLLQKIESTLHMTKYFTSLGIFLSFLSLALMAILGYNPQSIVYSVLGLFSTLGAIGVSIMYFSAVKFQGLKLKEKMPYLGFLSVIGVGFSAHYSISVLKGLLIHKHKFVNTPKYNVNNSSNPSSLKTHNSIKSFPYVESTSVMICLAGIYSAYLNNIYIAISSLFIFLISYLFVIYYTFKK